MILHQILEHGSKNSQYWPENGVQSSVHWHSGTAIMSEPAANVRGS